MPDARYRFGSFEIDCVSNELRRNGLRIRIEDQPFQILSLLVSRQGEVVTREELKNQLWAHNTHLDFDRGLNRAVNKVRLAIRDSASNPVFIETLPRRGYRFLAPVTAIADRDQSAPLAPVEPVRETPAPRRSIRGAVAYSSAAALVLVAAGAVVWRNMPLQTDSSEWKAVPLTSFVGTERHPALSPDGNQVAFSWDGPAQSNFDIYRKEIASGEPIRLTNDASPEYGPVWSPDGRTIAFMRRVGADRAEVRVVPAQGGPEHRITETAFDDVLNNTRFPQLSWSPDGRWLAFSDKNASGNDFSLFLVSLETGERRRLTEPPKTTPGDHGPAFAPDGRSVAFLRLSGHTSNEGYVVPLSADARPGGNARPLTAHNRWLTNVVWSQDGRHIFYALGFHLDSELSFLKVPALGIHKPRLIRVLDHRVSDFALGRHLVYSQDSRDFNIWRAAIPDRKHGPVEPHLFLASTRTDVQPQYSPDGRSIAFTSFRSGTREIWIADANGEHARQLTRFNGPLVGPANWAPDGKRILFHARPEGQADLFTIAVTGGEPKRLTSHPADDVLPSYSADGRTVYFTSRRSGRNEVWKMPAEGGDAGQVTHSESTSGAGQPQESRDGKTLYYSGAPSQGIFEIPVGGGAPRLVAGPINESISFCVTAAGIYFIAPPGPGNLSPLDFYEFATGRRFTITRLRGPSQTGLTVSPDGRFILFAQLDQSGQDLMLVPDFR